MSVWIIPFPFFSHALCLSQFGGRVAAELGVKVTLFLTNKDHQRTKELVESWEREGLDLQIHVLSNCESSTLADTPGATSDAPKFLEPVRNAIMSFVEHLKKAVYEGSQPTCVIADVCLGLQETIEMFGLPCWALSTLSPSCLAALAYLPDIDVKDHLEPTSPSLFEKLDQQDAVGVPGLPHIRKCDLPEILWKEGPGILRHGLAKPIKYAKILLFSTFQELEPQGIQGLQKLLEEYASKESRQAPEVWPVGPTFTLKPDSNETPEDPCIKFLDSQAPGSVVYISFGTNVTLSAEQVHELILGLEKAGHPFLCALNPVIPDPKSEFKGEEATAECLSRVADRGLMVGWAPQKQVLAHPSTGAFMTHCGQNSSLESASFGVPMLAWPWAYDQFINCRAWVDESQIAVEVCAGLAPGELVPRQAIEKCVSKLLGIEGEGVRERARQMKQMALDTVGRTGTSTKHMRALGALIKDLASKQLPPS